MPRATPPDRLEKLIEVAAGVFVEFGFQRAQMDDVAARLGVSKGTVYRSVESKDALLVAVLAHADDPATLPSSGFAEPTGLEELATSLPAQLARSFSELDLVRLADGSAALAVSRAARAEQLTRTAAEVFELMTRHRVRIMVLDRCAAEVPEFASWFDAGRYALVDLWEAYLERIADDLDPTLDRAALARTVVELITLWAVKMPWDPSPRPYPADPAAACAAMVSNLTLGGST